MPKADVSDFCKALEAIRNALPVTVERSLNTIAEVGVSNAKSSTLFKDRTGALRRRIQFLNDGALARTVIADTNYAGYVNFGNGPPGTKIFAKRKKVLRFEIDGVMIFRKWVRAHKPLPFMNNARDMMVSLAPIILGSDIEQLINKHSRG